MIWFWKSAVYFFSKKHTHTNKKQMIWFGNSFVFLSLNKKTHTHKQCEDRLSISGIIYTTIPVSYFLFLQYEEYCSALAIVLLQLTGWIGAKDACMQNAEKWLECVSSREFCLSLLIRSYPRTKQTGEGRCTTSTCAVSFSTWTMVSFLPCLHLQPVSRHPCDLAAWV